MNRVLILGASSDVGRACAEEFARNKFDIQLTGRKSERFESQCNDLHIKYKVNATAHEFDAEVYESHKAFVEGLEEQPDVVICMMVIYVNSSSPKVIMKNVIASCQPIM